MLKKANIMAIRPEEITSILERELRSYTREIQEVGVGTVLYALAIGPLAHVFVPLFARGRPTPEHALEAA